MNSDLETLINSVTSSSQRQQNDSLTESQLQEAESVSTTNYVSKKLPQYVAAITATLSALCAGVVLGWTSPILQDLEHGHFNNITVNNNQMGWIGSFVTLGGMSMCIPTGCLCDLIGRKKTLLLLIIPFSAGWALILFAHNVFMLYLGRFITGLAAGASCVAAPMYIGETSEKSIRGSLGSYFQLMVTIGVLFAYTFGKFLPALSYTTLCACLPFGFFALFAFQPESPVYCLQKNKHDMALKCLKRLRGENWDNEGELADMENSVKDSLEATISFRDTIRRKANYKAVLIAFALMFFQQFCGINAVILYTSDIFVSSGANLDANTAAILVGAFQVIATFLSSLYVDKLGRKILLLLSALIMSFSTLVLAIFFTLKYRVQLDPIILKNIGFIPIVSLCLFIIMFSIGLGPIPWMLSAEIFTPELKSIASAGAGTFNWFLAFIVTKFYLQTVDLLGQDTTYYGFSIFSLIGGVFIHFVVPETKGKTVEEVQIELER